MLLWTNCIGYTMISNFKDRGNQHILVGQDSVLKSARHRKAANIISTYGPGFEPQTSEVRGMCVTHYTTKSTLQVIRKKKKLSNHTVLIRVNALGVMHFSKAGGGGGGGGDYYR